MKEHTLIEESGAGYYGLEYLLVTLGCFRNEVESDLLRSELSSLGFAETTAVESADIIFVMTCGFVREACDEGIDTMLELDEIGSGQTGKPPMLAIGCMGQRYGADLFVEMPELAAVLGCDWQQDIEAAVADALKGVRHACRARVPAMFTGSRSVDSSDNATLYVRVADGCDRACGFCTIPSIRGPFVSRSPGEVIEEIERLSSGREREVILLAQDLTSYGRGLAPGQSLDLAGLVERITGVPGVHWLRMLYLQPEGVTARLIEQVAGNDRVCNYFDIPFQHASESVLRRMGRPGGADDYLDLISRIRRDIPDAAIRSTVMVGYPGETEEDFSLLMDFVNEARFDWLGAFVFSPEEGTAAAELGSSIPAEVSLSRYNMVVETQDEIEASGLDRFPGRELEVVVDEICEIEPYDMVGRSYREAPVVDGMIYLKRAAAGGRTAEPGDFVRARITGHEGLDLVGEI